jgi:hypothetical protein
MIIDDEYYHDVVPDTIYESPEDVSFYGHCGCDVTYEAKFLQRFDIEHSDDDMMSHFSTDKDHEEVPKWCTEL